MRKKFMFSMLKEHLIFMIGFVWVLIALLARFIIVAMNLQYDDGGLGTILILGKPIYAFPFWALAEISMPLKINEFISPYMIDPIRHSISTRMTTPT